MDDKSCYNCEGYCSADLCADTGRIIRSYDKAEKCVGFRPREVSIDDCAPRTILPSMIQIIVKKLRWAVTDAELLHLQEHLDFGEEDFFELLTEECAEACPALFGLPVPANDRHTLYPLYKIEGGKYCVEKDGSWTGGIILNEGANGVLDLYGRPLGFVYDWRRVNSFEIYLQTMLSIVEGDEV